MKFRLIIIFSLISVINVFSQWQNVFTSTAINYAAVSGWIHFDKVGTNWKSRLYTVDTISIKIMQPGYSNTVAYTYTFNAAEQLLGEQVYSTGYDLNGNNTADFYVLSGYGTSTAYREAFKVIDFSTGATIFEKNDPAWSYSYPTFYDLDLDGFLECIVVKYPYPLLTSYTYEIYKTTITGNSSQDNKNPIQFRLAQNFPNPFNPSTKINYSLSAPGSVKLRIYDIKGETIKTLIEDFKPTGEYEAEWTGVNDSGTRMPSGIYFYELIVNNQRQVNKMLLLK